MKEQLKSTQGQLLQTQERLQQGIDENESLFARLRQVESRGSGRNLATSSTLRRSRSSTGSMPLPLQLSANLKKSLPRLDSLSDLSNIDYDLDLDTIEKEELVDEYLELRTRFEKVVDYLSLLSPHNSCYLLQAVTEIRALKRELRDTQSNLDGFEVAHLALKQQVHCPTSPF